jgi:hypothetical protein
MTRLPIGHLVHTATHPLSLVYPATLYTKTQDLPRGGPGEDEAMKSRSRHHPKSAQHQSQLHGRNTREE